MPNKRKYKNYPRIYSISTVGIIKHNNSDFLIHPLRTDFTGGSGSGKSLVTDLLQLILIASKKFWKSPSEDNDNTTNEKREIGTLVLKASDFPMAYTFINVETAENKYITIGTFIKRNTGNIYPFIIQKGISWELENNNLQSFSNFLTFKNFLINNKIPKLEILKDKLNDEFGLQLKSFYNNSTDFHKHLFNNGILNIDLSKKDEHLKSYAEVLQYFGRGKAFDKQGTRSTQIKNFLFVTNNKEKEDEYKKQKKQIEKSQRQYTEQFQISERVKKRRDKLLDLLDKKTDFDKKLHNALWTETSYFFNKQKENERNLINSKKEITKITFQILKLDDKINNLEIKKIYEEINKLKKEIIEKTEEQTNTISKKENIEKNTALLKSNKDEKEKIFEETQKEKGNIEKVENWLNLYNTIDKVKESFENQANIEEKKQKLKTFIDYLNKKNIIEQFENSKYFSLTYLDAINYYSEQKVKLETEIKSLNKLKPLFDSSQKQSFAQWTIKNIKKLTKEQEEILFHLKDKSITKPQNLIAGNNYIPEPSNIFSNIKIAEKQENGFWINLNGIHEFVETISQDKLLFNNPETLQTELEKFGQNIKSQIAVKKNNLDKINNLQKNLNEFKGFNQEICEIYQEKEDIQDFYLNNTLKIHKDEFSELINFFTKNKPEAIKEEFDKNKSEYESATTDFQNNERDIKDLLGRIKKNKEEIEKLTTNLKNKENPDDSELFELTETQKEIEDNLKVWTGKIIIDKNFNTDKEEFENPLTEKEKQELKEKIENLILKTEKEKQIENAIKRKLNEISKENIEKRGRIRSDILTYIERKPKLEKDFENAEIEYDKFIKKAGKTIVDYKTSKKISDDLLSKVKEEKSTSEIKYKNKFDDIIKDPDLQIENDNTQIADYNFVELVKKLLPNVIKNSEDIENSLKNDIEFELKNINEKMLDFAGKNLMIIQQLFGNVEEQYEDYFDKIENLKDFFKSNRAAGSYYVELTASPSASYPIKWIKVLRQKAKTEIWNTGMWKTSESKTADEIIEETFREYSQLKNIKPTINKLLDTKSYFDIKIEFKNPNDENAPPSTGQGYAILALLNIAKLSLIDTDISKTGEIPKGIRYMPIDEVAGLGENFDMLYKIAEKYDYQILTMTITANDNEFETNNQYSYTLRKNPNPKDPNRNLSPFGIFTKYNLIESLEPYIEKIKDEQRN